MKYSYLCAEHGEQEVEQRISDDKLKTCPTKGCRRKAERLIDGGLGFQLKGSGWERDGYSSSANDRDRKRFEEQTS